MQIGNPPVSGASREVAILTEGKNLHTPVNGVKELSVCLSVYNNISSISAPLAAKPVFAMLASKNVEMGLLEQCFQAEVKFLTQK